MCGIVGCFSVNNTFSDQDIRKASSAINHRGPDGDGFYSDSFVQLAHRRLSIIDLDKRASQPMYSSCKRYMMVYNGEVYNYVELRKEIESKFKNSPLSVFKTTSDTEVILRLFEIKGVDFVKDLNGMFAIAIYDTQDNKLFLFRDRFGIKPLYYYHDSSGNFCFASELKAILAIDGIRRKVNNQSVAYFLHTGFVPAPLTIYENIFKLESGNCLIIDRSGLEIQPFVTSKQCSERQIIDDEKGIIQNVENLLIESVKIQLRSDVPYGVFLSGGVDSSLLTAIAAENVNEKLNTFSIGFTEQSHNESEHARVIAKHIGTNHHEFVVYVQDAIDLIETFFEVYDEPYTDTSGIPTMLVSKLASKHVKVVLSGEGGDELFFGYGTHNWAKRLNTFPFNVFRSPLQKALSCGSSRSKRVAHLLDFDKNSEFLPEHIYSQEQYLFSNKEIVELVSDELKIESLKNIAQRKEELEKMFSISDSCLPEERQANYELKFPFQDDLLTKVDRATMFHSIEARVPYLDNNLVEYVFSVASDIKIKNGVNKYPLKKILANYVPEELFMRPKKGFSIPLAKWLKSDWKYLLDRYLDKKIIQQAGLVKFDVVQKLIQRFLSGEDYLYNRIWCLIVLHRWYEREQ